MASKWDVNEEKERKKLAPKEDDWKLAGSGADESLGRGKRLSVKLHFLGDDTSSSDGLYIDGGSSSKERSSTVEDGIVEEKPKATRLIFEADALRNLLSGHLKCPQAARKVLLMMAKLSAN
jgi:hypothetical protein